MVRDGKTRVRLINLLVKSERNIPRSGRRKKLSETISFWNVEQFESKY